jgi:hypothetical protein
MTSACWLDFVRLDSGRVQGVGGSEHRCGMLASAAGRWLAIGPSPPQQQHSVSFGPAVWLVDPPSGRIQPVPGTACMGWYAVGDDGRVAACGRDALKIVARDGHVTRAPLGEAGVFLGDHLLIDTSDSVRSIGTRPAPLPPLTRGEIPLRLGVGPDGSIAVAALKGGNFGVVVAAPERRRVRVAVDQSLATSSGSPWLTVSRGGELVAIHTYGPGGETHVELADTSRGRVALATAALPADMSDAAFAPDGCCTAIAAPDGIVIYTNRPLTPRWYLPGPGTAALAWLAAG